MSDQKQVSLLLAWVEQFDHSLLSNEDDVETKFILPLFKHLGYTDSYRRGKYPIKTYNPKKRGRKPEIDEIYFSTDNDSKQDENTSLILVEAKGPKELDLTEAIEQAKFYSHTLKPLVFVVTNGYHINIFKLHRFRAEEIIFEGTIDHLKNESTAKLVYDQINFETMKRAKNYALDELTHKQLILLDETIRNSPDLQAILAQREFKPSSTLEGNQFKVIKPKVAIDCKLPVACGKGECLIEFSNPLLRSLTIHLTHEDILGNLMRGLHTSPSWKTRSFLQKTESSNFEARLGKTTVILSEGEANELCECIDEVFQEYKNRIIEAENILGTWNYELKEVEGESGFHILTVKKWLWKLMKQFADEHDYDNGNTEWYIFEIMRVSIRVCYQKFTDCVFIYPQSDNYFLPSEDIDIMYLERERDYRSFEDTFRTSWKKNVGSKGFWTAPYTQKWLSEQFIPQVLLHYQDQDQGQYLEDYQFEQIVVNPLFDDLVPFDEMTEPRQLLPYLNDVQTWFITYRPSYINASILQKYYTAFTDLAIKSNLSMANTQYISGKLNIINHNLKRATGRNCDTTEDWCAKILRDLRHQAARIRNVQVEEVDFADLISRAFLAILRDAEIILQQKDFNMAKEALQPLWERSRFEMRYVYPHQ